MQAVNITASMAAQVLEIAREAGNTIMNVYQTMCRNAGDVQGVLVARKSDDSPLTQADLLAHQLIAQKLAAWMPAIAIVSEEDAHSLQYRLPNGTFWLVDPLDGTKEFLARNAEFTVNIALIQDGKAVLGVVVAPALGQAYWGGCGLGAFRAQDGQIQAIRVALPAPSGQPLRVVASKSHMNEETLQYLDKLGPHELVQAGSSLKFCRVAEGSADVYPRLGPTCEWDTAAAQAIVEAAGGHVTRLDGTPLGYGKPDVLNPYFVASNVPIFQENDRL